VQARQFDSSVQAAELQLRPSSMVKLMPRKQCRKLSYGADRGVIQSPSSELQLDFHLESCRKVEGSISSTVDMHCRDDISDSCCSTQHMSPIKNRTVLLKFIRQTFLSHGACLRQVETAMTENDCWSGFADSRGMNEHSSCCTSRPDAKRPQSQEHKILHECGALLILVRVSRRCRLETELRRRSRLLRCTHGRCP